jgi:hypothetical protein
MAVSATIPSDTPDPTPNPTPTPNNQPPVAKIGAVADHMSGQTVTIDGCGASDPDGDTITYLWTQTQGESITLTDRTSPTLSFVTSTVKQSTTLAFQLTVNEGSLSDKASVQFLVLPVSSTGLCDTVEEHNSLMLSCPSGQVIGGCLRQLRYAGRLVRLIQHGRMQRQCPHG